MVYFFSSNYNDYESDEENENTKATLDSWLQEELEENKKLDIIYEFKKDICKSPDLGAINNLSSYRILDIIENKNFKNKTKYTVTHEEWMLFDDLFKGLYGGISTLEHYNQIKNYLSGLLYVNPRF